MMMMLAPIMPDIWLALNFSRTGGSMGARRAVGPLEPLEPGAALESRDGRGLLVDHVLLVFLARPLLLLLSSLLSLGPLARYASGSALAALKAAR